MEPIPFFAGLEDASFLAKARSLGMDVWGLDQEFCFGPHMLMDVLLEKAKGKPYYAKAQQAHAPAKESTISYSPQGVLHFCLI